MFFGEAMYQRYNQQLKMMSVWKHSIVQPRASHYDTKLKRKLQIYLSIPIELPLLGLVKLTDSVSAS